jgi:hypothetical protein
MSFFNNDFLPIVQKHVGQIRAKGDKSFSTVDLIRKYIGHFYSDETNAHDSINANIGKFLKENDKALGINEQAADQPVDDDNGKQTKTSIWEFI